MARKKEIPAHPIGRKRKTWRFRISEISAHFSLRSSRQGGTAIYGRDLDWVLASAKSKGKTPRSAGVAGQDYLRPAAVKAGVIPDGYKGRFGWHNLGHSLATFFAANNVNLPVIQSVLRHAKPTTTAVYMHRVNAAQMSAQGKFLDAIRVTKTDV